jgi:hypothetical protein
MVLFFPYIASLWAGMSAVMDRYLRETLEDDLLASDPCHC